MFDVTKTAGVNEKSTCNQVPASNQTPITGTDLFLIKLMFTTHIKKKVAIKH